MKEVRGNGLTCLLIACANTVMEHTRQMLAASWGEPEAAL